jgi:hypothetical protein
MFGGTLREAGVVLVQVAAFVAICSTSALQAQTAEDPPQASTVSAFDESELTTFVDKTLIGRDESDVVGKWIRVFTADHPAGVITKVIAFDSGTGMLTLEDPLPAGAVKVNDVYHLADSRDLLLPSSVDPATVLKGAIGCSPAGTESADAITCVAIDATGVDAKAGDDTVAVTPPTIVVVTKFASPGESGSEEDETDSGEDDEKDAKSEARALQLGDGDDQVVNDGVVVSAAVAVVSESPDAPEEGQDETKAAAKAEPTATGLDGGDGQNVITNNGTLSTSATALLLARQIPGTGEDQKSADVSSTAKGTSAAITAGDGGSFVTNTGTLTSRAIAIAAGVGISTSSKDSTPDDGAASADAAADEEPSEDGTIKVKGDVSATATADGISLGSGADTITNTGETIVKGSATALAGGFTDVKSTGSAGASATSTAKATANGLSLGGGNDTVFNTGALTVDATARAIAVEIAVTDKNHDAAGTTDGAAAAADEPEEGEGEENEAEAKPLSSTVDGSTTATATATGIVADGEESEPDSEPIFDFEGGRVTIGQTSSKTHTSGNDTVTNSGTMAVTATARATDAVGGVTVDGDATTKAPSTATATALGVNLGGGNDTLANSGSFTATAEATSTALSVAVAQKATSSSTAPPSETPGSTSSAVADEGDDEEPAAKNTAPVNATIEASATATATATGVTADGTLQDSSDEWSAAAGGGQGFDFTRTEKTTQASGVDTVTNSGSMVTTATAVTRAASLGISVEGGASAKITSAATAAALGVDLGAGKDTLTNTASGTLTTTADATANALSLQVGAKTDASAKDAVKSAAETSANATARATAISADGLVSEETKTTTLGIGGGGGLSALYQATTTVAEGDDTVVNDGAVSSTATATTRALGVSVAIEGDGTTKATSDAIAGATTIDLGGGHDTLTSTGPVSATATATANALGLSAGIHSEPSATPPEGESLAAADGETPGGTPTTPTTPVKPAESTVDASATAQATAVGVNADGATANELFKLQLQLGGGVGSFLTVQSDTTYASGNDTVTNSGTVSTSVTASSRSESAGVEVGGTAAVKNSSKAEAVAAGMTLGGGDDTVTNNTAGTLTATSDANATGLSLGVGVKSGQADAKAAAESSATAEARAVGIAADALTPDSTVTATIGHLEGVLSIDTTASYVRASGNDVVTNHAAVTSTATATSTDAGLGVAIDGSASAKTTSSATAQAGGIDAGGGNDTVTNNGALSALADATANGLGIAVGLKGTSDTSTSGDATATAADGGETPTPTKPAEKKSAVESSVTATASAIGIGGDSVNLDTTATGSLKLEGLNSELHLELVESRESGDDTIANTGAIDATATATSRAGAVGVTTSGEISAKVSSTAETTAAGIDGGGGTETVTNGGKIVVNADATAHGLDVGVALAESSGGSGGGTSAADAAEGTDSRAKSTVEADATAKAVSVGIAADGLVGGKLLKLDLAVGNFGTDTPVFSFLKSETREAANDDVTNTNDVEAHATATTNAAAIGVTANGAASAKVSSSAEARATAIDLGGGADELTTGGMLVATAESIARGLAASVTNKGTATSTEGELAASEGLWKGGIESKAAAFGIDGMGTPGEFTNVDVRLGGTVDIEVTFSKGQDSVAVDDEGNELPVDDADTISNSGGITATANATASALSATGTGEGVAAAVTDIESEAGSTGIRGGQGDDVIENLGIGLTTTVTAVAESNAGTIAVSGKGLAVAADTVWTTGTKSDAAAVGLDGDGEAFETKEITVVADSSGVSLVIDKRETSGAGDDEILNEQALTVSADASAPSLSVALEAKGGVAASVSSVETEATAAGVRGGGGNDVLTNFGTVLVDATAFSAAANIAIAAQGVTAAGGSIWDGGTTAEAKGVGIDADGGDSTIKTTTLTVDSAGVKIEKKEQLLASTGHDTVNNTAGVTATAYAETDSAAVAGTAKGVSAAFAQSTAEALAEAIRGGGGDDTLTNGGALTATSTAIARALNVSLATTGGVAVAGNGVWDGGTTAEATAVGIRGDGGTTETTKTTTIRIGGGDFIERETVAHEAAGADTIVNSGSIDATATARTPSASVSIAVQGLGVTAATSTAKALAAAIDAGGGDDSVTNHGELHATSDARATTINGSGASTGVAISLADSWEGGVEAESTARGIDAGSGFDTVTNDGRVNADAYAQTLTGTVAVALTGVPVAVSTSTATATATAIDASAGVDADTVENLEAEDLAATPERDGALTATASALAATGNVTVTNAGVAASADSVWDGGTKAVATARGVATGSGIDTVVNEGDIDATSTANSGSAAVSVAVTGVAVTAATSTAVATADAIETGHDDDQDDGDTVANSGTLTVDATALAGSLGVGVTTAGLAAGTDALWDGGTTAEALARGIATGAGNDTITNAGAIDAGATAGTTSVQVDVAVSGVAVAAGNATGEAKATAIDAAGSGVDEDTITNTGVLTATAFGVGTTVNVPVTTAGVTVAGNAVWDGGTKGLATATAIGAGNGADTITNDGDSTAKADAWSVTVPVSVSMAGVAAGIATSTAVATSSAIDAGAGVNTIVNTGAIHPVTLLPIEGRTGTLVAESMAIAATPSVSFTPAGLAVASDAVWDGGTTAEATSLGIRTGLDVDTITNVGDVESSSTALSGSLVVGVSLAGVAAAAANSTALANATAIDADAEPAEDEFVGAEAGDVDTIVNQGTLTANAVAGAISLPIAVTTAGVALSANSVWDGGTTADSVAVGIRTAAGEDVIDNTGQIDAIADSTSGSLGASVAVAGFAASVATSTGKADATAIDAGADADTITNTGALTADAGARAGTVTVGVTTAGVAITGDAVWDGGTKAEATARGLSAADGDDSVKNDGDVTAISQADTKSVGVTVTVAGVGVAVATSTAAAQSTALDAGAGDDTVSHVDPLLFPGNTLTAHATANAMAAVVTVVPAGVAIAADAAWEGGTSADATAAGIDTGLGADTVTNASEIESSAWSETIAVNFPITVYGVSAAIVNATSISSATGIRTGVDERDEAGAAVGADLESEKDTVVNAGTLSVLADTLATSAAIAFTFGGVAGVANAVWDGGTTGEAFARGIGVGNGADEVINSGVIDASAIARAVSATLPITVFGVSAATSTATSEARAWGIDGGDGDDAITNLETGALTSSATATGVGVNVGFVAIGATVASDTVWDGGTKAVAVARSIGGGIGKDTIANDASISSVADADTASVSVTITGIGVGGALATSTSQATALAIDGGADDDTIANRGDLTATSVAEGRGIGVSATGIGAGVSSDAFFKGGTTAAATATGIAGGAGNDVVWHLPELPPSDLVALAALPVNTIRAEATSDAQSTQVSVTLGGFAGVVAGSTSTARATAVDGGDGDDDLFVLSDVESTASATADGASVAVALVGVAGAGSLVDNVTRAESVATGIAGGDGGDEIVLGGETTATLVSTASTKDTAVSVTLAGLAAADTQAIGTARAVGLDGGAGDDTLTNEGTVTGTLTADSKARSVSVAVNVAPAGGATGNASGGAEVFGTGLAGGAGNDTVTNSGTVSLTGTATARGNNVSVGGTGVSDADATSTSTASLTGLAGGAGVDTVVNDGSIDATANAVGTSTGTSVTLTVASFADANATSAATARGIDGGDDKDVLTNALGATVDATASASTVTGDTTVNLIGASSGGARANPTGTAIGLDGGAGNDTVVNEGTVTADATATSSSTSSSFNLAGSTGTTAGVTTQAFATGIAGGADDDMLVNDGDVTATGFSNATVSASSWTLAGAALGASTLNATGSAVGMSGDAGVDKVFNLGGVSVTFEAKLRATGGSDAIFGGASLDTQLAGHGSAFGITGGDGTDTIRNFSDIDVLAKADVGGTKTAVSFAGSPNSDALLVARADATGISGGIGDDTLENDGVIRVDVSSLSTVTGGAQARAFGGAASSGAGTADGTGIGMHGDDGANTIVNAKTLDVDVFGDSLVTNSATSGLIVGDADTRADAWSTMSAIGIASGIGNSAISNVDRLDVLSFATAYGFANASGAHIDWAGDGTAVADAQATATSVGISVLGGNNTIVNKGGMNVTARATTVRAIKTQTAVCTQELQPTDTQIGTDANGDPIYEMEEVTVCVENQEVEETNPTPTYAGGNGNGVTGKGTATSLGDATAEAVGIRAGDGATTIVNLKTGTLEVIANPVAKTTSFADGDLKGNAFATSDSDAEGLAVGLLSGHGANTIINEGSISVLANPLADASARATGGDAPCITFLFWTWCASGGTGTGTANAVFDAEAVGIRTGDGDNLIVNAGLLTVTAAPETSDAPTDVASADVRHRSVSVTSRAVGVETGNGNNTIVNTSEGVIAVEARDLPVSYSCQGSGACSRQTNAIGILTGSGNDVVVNDGMLSAHTISTSKAPTKDIAIDTGEGNDRVMLGTGSQTTGQIALGTGDDRFVWSSNAILDGAVTPGDGTDTFALGGDVSDSFNLNHDLEPYEAFEQFAKEGESTWTLTGTRAVDWMVEDGTLAVGGSIHGTLATDSASAALAPTIRVDVTGTVTQAGVASAVVLGDNGTLRNDGSIAAVIGAAVDVTGHGARVVNTGQIASSGVAIALAGQGASLDNDGTIAGLGGGAAIVVGGGHVTLRNDGSISAGAGGAVRATGDDVRVINDGQMASSGVVVNLSGQRALFDNSGAVTGQAGGPALVMGGGNSVLVNGGSITAHGTAIVSDGLNPTLVNTGRISGASGAVWIDSADGSNASIVNEASGAIESAGGPAIRGGAGVEQLTNAGLIAGGGGLAIDLAGGDDELRLIGGAVIDGTAAGGAGLDRLVLGGTTGLFELSAVGSDFIGFEDMRIQGTLWTLDGVGTSDWTIDQGTLALAGQLTGTIATNPDASGVHLRVLSSGVLTGHDGATAAWLRGGATLANAGLIESGGGTAVSIEGVGNVLVNEGLIGAGGGGAAVDLAGSFNTVINLGELTASGSGGSALSVDGAGNTIVNDGRIAASGGSRAVLVSADDTSVSNVGEIVSTGDGVVLRGDGGALLNLGLVSGGAGGSAVVLGGRESLLENLNAIASEGTGVTVIGDGSLVSNLGSLVAADSAVVFETEPGAAASLVNAPGALVQSARGFGIEGGEGNETIENDGVVVSGAGSAIDLGGGDDLLRLSTSARIGGTVAGGAGFDTLTLDGSGGLGLDLDTFGGFEMLRKQGPGTWLLAGSSTMAWDVSDGLVVLDGSLTGDGALREGAWLAGNGTLGGFSNAGTVSPGMSLGLLRVAGDYVQTASGTLQIEGAIFTDVSDRLVIDGRASLDGRLEVLPESRPFGVATEYVVLEAAGGVTGTFGATTSGLATLDPFMTYTPQSVAVTLVRNDISFRGMADTTNARALGTALDASKLAMARGDFKPLMDEFLLLDAGARAQALRTLTGELHASVPMSLLRTGEWFLAASAHRRISAQQAGERVRVWTDVARFGGDVDGDGNASRARFGASGLVGGMDVRLGGRTRLGASLGYSRGDTELDGFTVDRARASSLLPAVYGEQVAGPVRVEGAFGYGRHTSDTVRAVRVGSIVRDAHAKYEADQYSGLARAGVALPSPRAFLFEPFVELRYSSLTRPAFDETGADSANLSVTDEARVESLRSLVGVRASWAPEVFGVRVEPDVSVAWARASLDRRGTLVGVLSGATARPEAPYFAVQGPADARDGVAVSIGANAAFGGFGRAFASYDGAHTETSAGHQFSAGVRFLW